MHDSSASRGTASDVVIVRAGVRLHYAVGRRARFRGRFGGVKILDLLGAGVPFLAGFELLWRLNPNDRIPAGAREVLRSGETWDYN